MSLDEALEAIKRTEECWVVWRSDTGEVVSVSEVDPKASPQQRGALPCELQNMPWPVTGRFLHSASVTRQTLEAQKADSERVSIRIEVLDRWFHEPPSHLVERLELGMYQWPMGGFVDANYQIGHLFRLHRDDLAGPLRERLRGLAKLGPPFPGMQGEGIESSLAVLYNLKCIVAALDGDVVTLTNLFTEKSLSFENRLVHMECFAHAHGRDQRIIMTCSGGSNGRAHLEWSTMSWSTLEDLALPPAHARRK